MTACSPSAQVVRQAINWMVRLRENGHDMELQQQCEHWRAAREEHEHAWQRVSGLHRELDLRAVPGAGMALQTLDASHRRLQRRQVLKLLGAAAVVGSSAWLSKDLDAVDRWTSDYASATGERRSFSLPDGSLLQPNTHTAVDLAFDGHQRLVQLKRGELMLTCDTPTHAQKPLLVQTRDSLLEGFAGRFSVRQDVDGTRISVTRGKVAMHLPGNGQVQWAVSGQDYRLDAHGARLVEHPDMDANAWVDGLIVTRDMRLADFLSEVGRYRQGVMSCAGDIAGLRLSGVFRLEDTDKLLELLPQTLPVRVSYRTRWWVRVDRLV